MNGGLVMNFGICNANSTGTTITFNYPYANSVLSFGGDSNTVASTIAITSANTTKMVVTSNTTTNVSVGWQTFGF